MLGERWIIIITPTILDFQPTPRPTATILMAETSVYDIRNNELAILLATESAPADN